MYRVSSELFFSYDFYTFYYLENELEQLIKSEQYTQDSRDLKLNISHYG